MCFFYDDDCDWIARVFEETTKTADKSLKCLECFGHIAPGEQYTHIHMQEYECCRVCDADTRAEWIDANGDWDSEDWDGETLLPPCADGQHNFGHQDWHRICERCQKLLAAIQHVEEDDGCEGDEARPAIGQLREAFWESDHADEYIDRARQEFPELAMSGHLDQFYKLTEEWREDFEEQWSYEDLKPVDEHGGEGG